MLRVEQSHANICGIGAEHQVPELLCPAYVENLHVAVQLPQERQEKLEAAAPHARRERPRVTVVGQRANQRSLGADRRRPRRCRHAGASSSAAGIRTVPGTDSRWATVTATPANQK